MFKRIGLGAVLLVAIALVAHVWADQGCEVCGEAWDAADEKMFYAQDFGFSVNESMSEMDNYKTLIAYCHDNHGGAESESNYQAAMSDGNSACTSALGQYGLGLQRLGGGISDKAIGDTLCPGSCAVAANSYDAAEAKCQDAISYFSQAAGEFSYAAGYYDDACWQLVAEENGEPCMCQYY